MDSQRQEFGARLSIYVNTGGNFTNFVPTIGCPVQNCCRQAFGKRLDENSLVLNLCYPVSHDAHIEALGYTLRCAENNFCDRNRETTECDAKFSSSNGLHVHQSSCPFVFRACGRGFCEYVGVDRDLEIHSQQCTHIHSSKHVIDQMFHRERDAYAERHRENPQNQRNDDRGEEEGDDNLPESAFSFRGDEEDRTRETASSDYTAATTSPKSASNTCDVNVASSVFGTAVAPEITSGSSSRSRSRSLHLDLTNPLLFSEDHDLTGEPADERKPVESHASDLRLRMINQVLGIIHPRKSRLIAAESVTSLNETNASSVSTSAEETCMVPIASAVEEGLNTATGLSWVQRLFENYMSDSEIVSSPSHDDIYEPLSSIVRSSHTSERREHSRKRSDSEFSSDGSSFSDDEEYEESMKQVTKRQKGASFSKIRKSDYEGMKSSIDNSRE